MQKLIVTASFLIMVVVGFAQQDSLQQYVGKYKFPDGSVVTEVTVVVENGGLMMNSSAGSSALTKDAGEDAFIIVAFQGVAQFKRDANKKIVGVSINAMGYQLEGTKESFAISLQQLVATNTKKFAQLKQPVQ
jgi:hypothetical protein